MKNSFYILLILSIFIVINQGCKVRVSEASDVEIPIVIVEEIIIISPSKGDMYRPGNLLKIRWVASPNLSKVNIFLLKNDIIERTLAHNQENNETFGWWIEPDIDNSAQYSVKIENIFQKENFSISETFSILK